ncbi:condensation domain-containing protein [Streptomyces sp. NPDC006208]|uniref:condensation domain-containing protein n=1 Tax=Streptomyces sp. NPDC006208 TaxID=3156734 RepID=UPI0033A27B7A
MTGTSDIDALLTRLAACDVQLSAAPGGILRYDAPRAALTEALLDELRLHKDELLLRLGGDDGSDSGPGSDGPYRVTDRTLVSDQQARLIAGHHSVPHPEVWNIPTRVCFTGTLDVDALRAALGDLIGRHHALHTRFAQDADGAWWQEVVAPPPLRLPLDDLTALTAPERGPRADALCRQAARHRFELSEPVLPHLRLIQVEQDQWILMFVLHHICADGWSLSVILAELAALYTAAAAGTPRPPAAPTAQATDFARDARARHDPATETRRAAYFATYLDGVPPRTDIPTDRPRPGRLSGRGGTIRGSLSGEQRAAVEKFAAGLHTTPFAVAASALGVFLTRLSGEGDHLIGVPYANREGAAFETLVAMTSTTIMVRVRVDPDETCAALAVRTGAGALEAMAHVLPTARIMQAMRDAGARDVPDRVPHVLAFQNSVDTDIEIPGLRVDVEDLAPPLARAELCFGLAPRRERALGYRTFLEYSADLWDQETAERLLASYTALLGEFCSRPDARVGSLLQSSGKADTP